LKHLTSIKVRPFGIKEDLNQKGLKPFREAALDYIRIKEDLNQKGLKPLRGSGAEECPGIKEDLNQKGLKRGIPRNGGFRELKRT